MGDLMRVIYENIENIQNGVLRYLAYEANFCLTLFQLYSKFSYIYNFFSYILNSVQNFSFILTF